MSVLIKLDGLVPRIIARHVALSAVYAELLIDDCNHLLLIVQLVVFADARNSPPDLLRNFGDRFWLCVSISLSDGVGWHELGRGEQVAAQVALYFDFVPLFLVWPKLGKLEPAVDCGNSSGGRLAVPTSQVGSGLEIKIRLESGDVILNNGEVLILNR